MYLISVETKKLGHYSLSLLIHTGACRGGIIVALRIAAREAREKFLSATSKFLSATPIFRLLGVALRKIRCGASKCRCGDKDINVVEVIRLIEVKKIAYLQWR